MAVNKIYPFGAQLVSVPAGQSITVFSEDIALIFQKTPATKVGGARTFLGRINGNSQPFGPFANGATIIIEADASPVYYAIGKSPVPFGTGSQEVKVDQFRTVGAVSDNDAVLAASAAAGVNGIVEFSWDQYNYDASITPLAGQIWVGNKALLKKRAPFIATLTANANSGSSSFQLTLSTVYDSAGKLLRVGQQLNLYKSGGVWATAAAGATPDTQFSYTEQNNFTIVAVDPTTNIIKVTGNTLANNYVVGDFVVASCSLFYGPTVAGCAFRDFEFDDGRADAGRADSEGNIYGQWIANTVFFVAGDRTEYSNLYLHDTIGEGIILGGRGTVASGIRGLNTGGNLFHLTGEGNAASPTYDGGSIIENVYAKANSVGVSRSHQNGVVTISTPVPDFTLKDFKVDGTAADNATSVTPSFIGGISNTTRNLKIRDINCYNTGLGTSHNRTKNVVDLAASWGTGAEDCEGLEIRNFRAYDCGDFVVNKTDYASKTGRFINTKIEDIYISAGKMTFGGIGKGSKLNKLHVDNSYLTAGGYRQAYDFKNLEHCELSNFTSDSGGADQAGYAVDFSDNSVDVTVSGKNIQRGNISGIALSGTGGTSTLEGLEHNTAIVSGAGIRVNNTGWVLKNPQYTNRNTSGSGTGNTVGIHIAAQCVVINPLSRMHTASYTLPIFVAGGVTGAEIYNAVTTAATPVFDSGTSTKNINPQQTLVTT